MLYGREAECAAVEGLIAGAGSSQSGALVVRGDPGLGKSALLGHATERATRMRVLRAVGIEAESEIAFAALHQLVRPTLDLLTRLPEPQAAALAGALGLSRVSVQDRFLIGVGVLSLLAEAAEDVPLVCVVDDAQWLDRPSADALTFAARRLEAEGVVLLFAARDGELRRFEAPGLAELRLSRLGPDAAGALLTGHVATALSAEVRERLVENAGGNPLALIEFAGLLSDEQLAGRAPLPDPLPPSAEIERVYLRACARAGAGGAGVAPARRGRRHRQPGDRLRGGRHARHRARGARAGRGRGPRAGLRRPDRVSPSAGPLDALSRCDLRAAPGRPPRARRRLRRRPGRRSPRVAPGRGLARARRRGRRGARADRSASAAPVRFRGSRTRAWSARPELSGDDEARGRRLVAAAENAWLAGGPEPALALLDRADGLVADLRVRADVSHLRGTIGLRCGVPADAATILAAGAAEVSPLAPAKAIEMLVEAAQAASYAGDAAQIVEFGRRASALLDDDDLDERFTVDVIVGIGSLLAGDAASGVPLLREALALAAGFQDPGRLVHAGACAGYLGEEATEHELYGRAAARARETGAVAMLPYVLEFLARAEAVDGRYAAAAAHASEGLSLAHETGQQNSVCHLHASLALIAALQGREERVPRSCAPTRSRWRRPAGSATRRRSRIGRSRAWISAWANRRRRWCGSPSSRRQGPVRATRS